MTEGGHRVESGGAARGQEGGRRADSGEQQGGTIAMAEFQIPTVGSGCYFKDTEGNHVGAMQYERPPQS